MKRMNSKGDSNMTLGTILSIVLGLAVVVVLIWGFSVGWGNLWDKVTGRVSSSNVDAIISGCQLACDTGAIDDYCNVKRTVKFGDARNVTLSSDGSVVSTNVKEFSGKTCNQLSGYNLGSNATRVVACPTITCPA